MSKSNKNIEPDPKLLLKDVRNIAYQAGNEIMKHYVQDIDVQRKEGNRPVTIADKEAEKIILSALKKLTPNIPIVSEEDFADGHKPDTSQGTFWTVDPLDGTAEFINKTDAFVTAIALIVDHKPVLGVIYHPAYNLMYSSAGPNTASKIGPDKKETPISVRDSIPDDGAKILINKKHANMDIIKEKVLDKHFNLGDKDQDIETMFKVNAKDIAQVIDKSGIFRACQIAEGTADLFPHAGSRQDNGSWWWDVAPGHAIVEAAGGHVGTLDGNELLYNAHKTYRVPAHSMSAHKKYISDQKLQKKIKPPKKKIKPPKA